MRKLLTQSPLAIIVALASCAGPVDHDETSSLSIFGGHRVAESDAEYQHTVAVYPEGGLCSGTLIAPNLVVTAAHCFRSRQGIQVGFGQRGEKRIGVSQLWIHPNYNLRRSPPNDIALLRLSQNAPQGARPARIMNKNQNPAASTWVVAGYGVTDGSSPYFLASEPS